MSQATTVPKKRYVYRIPSFQTSCYLESNDSAASGSSNSSNRRYPLDSTVFALFLEPAEEVQSTYVKPKSTNTGLVTNNKEQEEEEDQIGLFAKLINFGVGFLQPSPAMQHVELVVPSSFYKTPVNFAIYYNMKSSWCGNRSINQSYYMEEHAYQWRALPVQFDNASSEVRRACNLNYNTVYSVAKSSRPSRRSEAYRGSSQKGTTTVPTVRCSPLESSETRAGGCSNTTACGMAPPPSTGRCATTSCTWGTDVRTWTCPLS